MPPPELEVLPEIVLFLMVRAPVLNTAPPPSEDPPVRVIFSIVRSASTLIRRKSGAFSERRIVVPLPSIVIRLVIKGRPIGEPYWFVPATFESVTLAFAGKTIVSAPLPAAQSGYVAASLLALTMASMSEHWPSDIMSRF